MDPTIYEDALRKVSASTAFEAKPSVKRFKAEVGSSQTSEGPEQETSSASEDTADEIGEEETLENWASLLQQLGVHTFFDVPAFALDQFERVLSPEIKQEESNVDHCERLMKMKIAFIQSMALAYQALATYSATIDCLSATVFKLKAEVASNSNKYAEAEAKLKMSKLLEAKLKSSGLTQSQKLTQAEGKLKRYESSQAQLSARVETLEAEMMRKQAEIEVLKSQAIAADQKASDSEHKALSLMRKIIEWDKCSKELSSAAAMAVGEFQGYDD